MTMLGVQRTSLVTLDVPMFGAWWADVELANGSAPASGTRLTLTVADQSFVGTVLPGQSGIDYADHPHVTLAGGIGWDRPLQARTYASDAGVRLATLLRDLASDTGETWAALPPDLSLGTLYDRPGSLPAAPVTGRHVLRRLWQNSVIPPWWIRGDGMTVLGNRPSGQSSGRAEVMRRDMGIGWRLLGLSGIGGFLPGLIIEGATIKRLVVRENGDAMKAEAWA